MSRKTPPAVHAMPDGTAVVDYIETGKFFGYGDARWDDRVKAVMRKTPTLYKLMPGCPSYIPKIKQIAQYRPCMTRAAINIIFQEMTLPGKKAGLMRVFDEAEQNRSALPMWLPDVMTTQLSSDIDNSPTSESGTGLTVPAKYQRIHTICKATPGQIGGRDALVVDARDLYDGLGVKGTPFANWLRRRVTDSSEFREAADFCFSDLESKRGGRGGHNAIICHLTLETAKRVSMAEGGEVGKLVRSYYLWTEGVVEEIATSGSGDLAIASLHRQFMDFMERQSARDAEVNARFDKILTMISDRAGSDSTVPSPRFGFNPPPQPATTKRRGQTSLRPFASEAKRWLKIRMPIQQIMAFLEERLVALHWAERGLPPNAYTMGNLLATQDADGKYVGDGYVINYQATRPDGVVFPMALNLTKEGAEYMLDVIRAEFLGVKARDERQSDFFRADEDDND